MLMRIAAFAVALSSSAFPAIVVVFNDQTVDVTTYAVNTTTGTATPILSGFPGWAAAYDPNTNNLYWNDGVTLYRSQFSLLGLSPTVVGTLTFEGNNAAVVGLAFDSSSNRLIATRNIGRGFYDVNLSDASLTLLAAIEADFGGFDYDANSGLFYGTNDSSFLQGPGLYSIQDLYTSPIFTLLTSYPDSQTDIDGLAVGGGFAYLITDQPGSIYVWNLSSSAFVSSLNSPITGIGIFSGGAFVPSVIPEPATATLLAAGLIAGVLWKRRRQAG